MKHTNKVKVTFLLAMFSLSIGVPAMSAMVSNVAAEEARAKEIGDIIGGISGISDPSMVGGVMGGLIAAAGAPDVFVEVLTLLFEQVYELQEQELLPGVYVLNAHSHTNTTEPVPYQEETSYSTWAPFVDTQGHYYRVHVDRSIDVNVTITQELNVVAILWDSDGSFVDILLRMLALYKDFEEMLTNEDVGPEGEPLTEQEIVYLAGRVTEVLAYVLIHINDIITGDEQIIFQPSYSFSYDFAGNMSDTRTWEKVSDGTIVDPGDIPGLAAAAADDPYLQYLMDPGHNMENDVLSSTGFIFQLYQLWMQKFQIQLDLGKLGDAITALADENSTVGEETFANALEGVEIAFSFTQHHLLGGGLFDDDSENGIPEVTMEGTGVNYTDSDGVEREVMVPTSSELKYILDLASKGDEWDVTPPTVVTNNGVPEIEWAVRFVNPTVYFKPVGMNHFAFHANGGAQEYDLEYLEFGFTFVPTSTIVILRNEINEQHTLDLREGKVKLDHSFGDFTVQGTSDPLPSDLSELALAFFYISNVFTFALDFSNVEAHDSVAINGSQGPVNNSYAQASGTLEFLDDSVDNTFLFASVDIAGPGYGPREDPFRWPASTAIIPYALFEYSFEAQQTVANDAFSVGQGEAEFRQQSLFVDMTSAWAFYCVAYPEWDGSELIHDPSFSIFMSLSVVPPWAAILIFVVIGSIAAVAIIMYVLKRPKNPLKREA